MRSLPFAEERTAEERDEAAADAADRWHDQRADREADAWPSLPELQPITTRLLAALRTPHSALPHPELQPITTRLLAALRTPPTALPHPPMQIKDYLLTVITACAPENAFAQDAIEYAIVSDLVSLTYRPAHDVMVIMGQYDKIIDTYRQVRQESPELLELVSAPCADDYREAA